MEKWSWFIKVFLEVNLALFVGTYILHKILLGFNWWLRYLIKMLKGEE